MYQGLGAFRNKLSIVQTRLSSISSPCVDFHADKPYNSSSWKGFDEGWKFLDLVLSDLNCAVEILRLSTPFRLAGAERKEFDRAL